MNPAIEAEEDAKYQRQLAAALAFILGFEEAIRACQAMSWHGGLLHLMNEKAAHAADARKAPGCRPG